MKAPTLKMDDASVRARHDKRKSWFLAEASRQASNRALMAKCEGFYDGTQWEHEDAERVRERGQNPVVFNEVKPTIDWLIGTERKSRVDFVVVAADEGEAASDDATLKTKLLKYLDDANRAVFERSYAIEDAFKAGLGWMEVGLRGDPSGPPIYIGAESWRNILYDSQGSKRDLSDARYLFRIKVVDRDVAEALFPNKKIQIDRCVQTGDDVTIFRDWLGGSGLLAGMDSFNPGNGDELDYMTARPDDLFNPRERILQIECWSREPQAQMHPVTGMADGVSWRMCCAVMTEKDTLIEAWSPFKHDLFPFIPVWAYRNKRTGMPYSPILPLLGPQEALNHRMSRSLYEASANQIKMEVGAIDAEVMDLAEIRRELDSPDGTAVFANGALSGGKVQERGNESRAQFQLQMAQNDSASIRNMSGVNADNMGRNSNVTSGKAVMAKQEQGSLLTMELFDNLLFARQMEGEITLSLAEQFLTQPLTIRVAHEGNKYDYAKLNQPQDDGSFLNDITQRKASFVIGEQAWKLSYAEAAFDSLMQVLSQLASSAPQVVVGMLDVVFEMHPNLPRKKAILERIRQVNGQSDPDGKETPEQQAAKQQQQQVAQAQFEAQMAQIKASIRESEAKGEKLEAEAMAKRLEGLYMSAQAAQVLAVAPGITPIADELLKAAGFQDSNAPGPVIDPAVARDNVTAAATGMTTTIPPAQQADGAMAGIETQRADGVQAPLAANPTQTL